MKRLRWFNRLSTFQEKLSQGVVEEGDICFILDRLRIYTISNSFDFSNRPIYQGETNSSDTAGTWTVSINGITELYDGLTVKIQTKTEQTTEGLQFLKIGNLSKKPIFLGYGIPLDSTNIIPIKSEITLTYRTQATSIDVGDGNGNSYFDGWILETSKVNVGNGLKNSEGQISVDFGTISATETNKTVSGAEIYSAIPQTYLESASVSGGILTIETSGGSEITFSHPITGSGSQQTVTGKYLTGISVDPLGHVSGVSSKTNLDVSDIPSLPWSKIGSGKPGTLDGYGIEDAKIEAGVITLGSESITPVTSTSDCVKTSNAQTITGTKTFTSDIVGNLQGNATTATTALHLAPQGSADYFIMGDGSLSNGYSLMETIVDQWSADHAGVLTTTQASSTVYGEIFE